jgi:hypothetical protein
MRLLPPVLLLLACCGSACQEEPTTPSPQGDSREGSEGFYLTPAPLCEARPADLALWSWSYGLGSPFGPKVEAAFWEDGRVIWLEDSGPRPAIRYLEAWVDPGTVGSLMERIRQALPDLDQRFSELSAPARFLTLAPHETIGTTVSREAAETQFLERARSLVRDALPPTGRPLPVRFEVRTRTRSGAWESTDTVDQCDSEEDRAAAAAAGLAAWEGMVGTICGSPEECGLDRDVFAPASSLVTGSGVDHSFWLRTHFGNCLEVSATVPREGAPVVSVKRQVPCE